VVWTIPVTPYRSFDASQVMGDGLDNNRFVVGINQIIVDGISQKTLIDLLVDRTRFPLASIDSEMSIEGNTAHCLDSDVFMCNWQYKTVNAVSLGAKSEISYKGMLKCTFADDPNKPLKKVIKTIQLVWDVMSFVLCWHMVCPRAPKLSVNFIIPNSLHHLQIIQKTGKLEHQAPHMQQWVLFEAQAPHRIIEVNKNWLEMFGYESSDEIIGKLTIGDFLVFPPEEGRKGEGSGEIKPPVVAGEGGGKEESRISSTSGEEASVPPSASTTTTTMKITTTPSTTTTTEVGEKEEDEKKVDKGEKGEKEGEEGGTKIITAATRTEASGVTTPPPPPPTTTPIPDASKTVAPINAYPAFESRNTSQSSIASVSIANNWPSTIMLYNKTTSGLHFYNRTNLYPITVGYNTDSKEKVSGLLAVMEKCDVRDDADWTKR